MPGTIIYKIAFWSFCLLLKYMLLPRGRCKWWRPTVEDAHFHIIPLFSPWFSSYATPVDLSSGDSPGLSGWLASLSGKYVCCKVSKNDDRVRGRDRECEEVWAFFMNGKETRSRWMTAKKIGISIWPVERASESHQCVCVCVWCSNVTKGQHTLSHCSPDSTFPTQP